MPSSTAERPPGSSNAAEARRGAPPAGARGGFLLLEAVIALAIMGLAAVAVLSATAGQVRSADKASVLLISRALAEDRLASLMVLGHADLLDPPDSLLGGTFPDPFGEFTWMGAVTEVEDEYDLFEIEVAVAGRGEVLPLNTMLHRPRPQILATGAQGRAGAAGAGGAAAGGGGGRGTGGGGGGGTGGGGAAAGGDGGAGGGGDAAPTGGGGGGGRGTGGGGGRGTGGGGGGE